MHAETKQKLLPLSLMSLSNFVVCLTATFPEVIALQLTLDLSPGNLMDFEWMFPIFLAGGCAGMALCAGVIDRYGRRDSYIVASLLFIVSTAIIATTSSMDVFLVARVFQGMGYGGVIVTCVSHIKYLIKDPLARYSAHGILSIGFGGGHLLGIFFGQFGLDFLGWREYMWVLLVCQVLLMFPCMKILKECEPAKMKADFLGAVTLAATIGVVLYVAQRLYMTHYVMDVANITAIMLTVLLTSLFIFVEYRDPESMLHRHIDDRKLMIASFIFIIMLGSIDMAAIGWLVKISLFVLDMSVYFSFVCFLFVIVGAVITAVLASKKIDKTGHAFWFTLASILSVVALFSALTMDIHCSPVHFCIILTLIGAAIGCLVSLLNATIQNRTTNECSGFFTSTALMARTAGLWLGFSMYQFLVDINVSSQLGPVVSYWNSVLGLDLPHDSSLANFLMTPLADFLRLIPGLVDSIGVTFINGVNSAFVIMGLVFLGVGLAVTYFLVRGRKVV